MCSKIVIRTGIRAFAHNFMEKMKLFYQSIKCVLYLNRKYVKKFENDLIEDENIQAIVETPFVIPDFNPSTAVLFITDYVPRRFNKSSLLFFRNKVQQECRWLLDRGYKDFIVDYGCNYGVLALLELLKLKKELEFKLFYGKVRREHATCITTLDRYGLISQCWENGAQAIGILNTREFIDKIINKVSMISYEKRLIKIEQKLPSFIHDYHKKKEQEQRY